MTRKQQPRETRRARGRRAKHYLKFRVKGWLARSLSDAQLKMLRRRDPTFLMHKARR